MITYCQEKEDKKSNEWAQMKSLVLKYKAKENQVGQKDSRPTYFSHKDCIFWEVWLYNWKV